MKRTLKRIFTSELSDIKLSVKEINIKTESLEKDEDAVLFNNNYSYRRDGNKAFRGGNCGGRFNRRLL